MSAAAGDIAQHRVVNPEDWDDDWICDDPPFELSTSDERFLEVLVETLHPGVRPDTGLVREMLGVYNEALSCDGYEIVPVSEISGATVYGWRQSGQSVAGNPKNLIFAGLGAKPEVVIEDAINNDLRIVSGGDRCLAYDCPLPAESLTWDALADWWAEDRGLPAVPREKVYSGLYGRLGASVANAAELRIFEAYGRRYRATSAPAHPGTAPQVYLQYDPYTVRQRGGAAVLARQRMDFLMLCPRRIRIVIECDGRQHYADGDRAAPGGTRRRWLRTASFGSRGMRCSVWGRRAHRRSGHHGSAVRLLRPPRRALRILTSRSSRPPRRGRGGSPDASPCRTSHDRPLTDGYDQFILAPAVLRRAASL